MVSLPGGLFTMGDRNGEPAEYPERQIEVSPFKMDLLEVSNAAYRLCVAAKACEPTPYLESSELGLDAHPVVGVTFEDAAAFCGWVGRRLPTEAEWEYAARGTDLRKWPWPGGFDPTKANSNDPADFHSDTAPVDGYPTGESPFGLRNLAGNVAEWVSDYFDPTFYRTSKSTLNPTGPEAGRERVIRGGSYVDGAYTTRVSARAAKLPTEADSSIGFRCAKDE